MSQRATLRITVTKSTSNGTMTIRSLGRYGPINTNTINLTEFSVGLFPTTTEQAFWAAVLAMAGPLIAAT